jgi:hypothetical protein
MAEHMVGVRVVVVVDVWATPPPSPPPVVV